MGARRGGGSPGARTAPAGLLSAALHMLTLFECTVHSPIGTLHLLAQAEPGGADSSRSRRPTAGGPANLGEHRSEGLAPPGVLCGVTFDGDERWRQAVLRRFGDVRLERGDPAGAAVAFDRYFSGDLHALDGLEIDPGGTPFQCRVWLALRTIRPGSTLSYQELASRIGSPAAVRAVGAANGANPIPIVVPCHRVIGAQGTLVGYGGGLERKDWLLRHEGWRPLAP